MTIIPILMIDRWTGGQTIRFAGESGYGWQLRLSPAEADQLAEKIGQANRQDYPQASIAWSTDGLRHMVIGGQRCWAFPEVQFEAAVEFKDKFTAAAISRWRSAPPPIDADVDHGADNGEMPRGQDKFAQAVMAAAIEEGTKRMLEAVDADLRELADDFADLREEQEGDARETASYCHAALQVCRLKIAGTPSAVSPKRPRPTSPGPDEEAEAVDHLQRHLEDALLEALTKGVVRNDDAGRAFVLGVVNEAIAAGHVVIAPYKVSSDRGTITVDGMEVAEWVRQREAAAAREKKPDPMFAEVDESVPPNKMRAIAGVLLSSNGHVRRSTPEGWCGYLFDTDAQASEWRRKTQNEMAYSAPFTVMVPNEDNR